MDLQLSGKRALVLAASSGLGLAVARELHAEGASVALCSRSLERATEAAADIAGTDGSPRVHAFEADVSDAASLERLFAGAVDALGGLDILVCNAGGPPPGGFSALSESDWDGAYRLTLQSVVRSVRLAVPHLEVGGGSILALASSSVKQPIPNLLLSNVFRPAVNALCKHLASELAPKGIRVNVLSAGRVHTQRIEELDAAAAKRQGKSVEEVREASIAAIPLGRLGDPAEFGRVGAFLCSGAASYVTGSSWLVDGGMVKSL